MQNKTSLDDALQLMRDLRKRCDWDAAQTHQSLRPYLIEEAYELDDALRDGSDTLVREELGDVLLQVLFHAVLAEERGAFDAHDVADALITKMRDRHPHLYGDGKREPWERMKSRRRDSLADGLPAGLPPLHRAHRLQDRAAGAGFDWPDAAGPADKVAEELAEVREHLTSAAPAEAGAAPTRDASHSALNDARRSALEGELGDLLFACVNLCRKAGVHASLALDRANAKFQRRFEAVERLARERGFGTPGAATAEELDELWEVVKAAEA